MVGAALAWSAPAWRAWNLGGRADTAADAAAVSALAAGVALAAIGLVPRDRLLGPHMGVVDTAFSLLLAFMAALSVVQIRNGAPRSLWITNVVALAVLAVYVVTVLRAGLREPATLRFAIVAQKVAVGVALADIGLQAGALSRVAAPRAEAPAPGAISSCPVGADAP